MEEDTKQASFPTFECLQSVPVVNQLHFCLTLRLSKYNIVKQGRAGHKLIPPNPIMKITKRWSWYSSRSACYSLFFKFKKTQPYFTYISISLLAPSSRHILNYQTRSKKCLSIIFSPVEWLPHLPHLCSELFFLLLPPNGFIRWINFIIILSIVPSVGE